MWEASLDCWNIKECSCYGIPAHIETWLNILGMGWHGLFMSLDEDTPRHS
jgi:hypothetical protein